MKIGIVGGTGAMGRWFRAFFEGQGLKVLVGGKTRGLPVDEVVKNSDVVIVSVPLEKTQGVIRKIGPLLTEDQLFMDFSSVKVMPVEEMLRCSRCEVVGAHPLFGPRSNIKDDLTVCLCPARGKNWLERMKKIFERGGLSVLIVTPEEHDRAMALIQGVHHLSNFTLGVLTKKALGKTAPSFFTPSFRKRMALITAALKDSSELYRQMILLNPFFEDALRSYINELRNLSKKAKESGLQMTFEALGSLTLPKKHRGSIAYLGPEGTFSHLAALRIKPEGWDLLSVPSISDVFRAAEKKEAEFAIVPVENSLEGMVNETHDLLIESPLNIQAELSLRVSYVLASPEEDLAGITKVYSHPQGLAQCRGWLRKNLPWAEEIPVGSTAQAALRASKEKGTGSLVAKGTAELYGLRILAESIEDSPHNSTRFFLLGDKPFDPGKKREKASLCFFLPHVPGALHRALSPLAEENINLSRIVSRPIKGSRWEYVFFIDMEIPEREKFKKALDRLKKVASVVKVLGEYPILE